VTSISPESESAVFSGRVHSIVSPVDVSYMKDARGGSGATYSLRHAPSRGHGRCTVYKTIFISTC
jgi:hypothetical protein